MNIKENKAAFILIISWCALFLLLRTLQHFSFGTNALDLSLFDHAMYNTLRGRMMYVPFMGYNHLAVHFHPVLFIFVPFYLIFQGPLFLLYIQVLAVGASSYVLYSISEKILRCRVYSLMILLIYLFNSYLLRGVMYDFHMEMLFPLFLFAVYYFLVIRHSSAGVFASLLLALSIKEDIAIYMFFFLVLCAFLFRDRRKICITASFVSLAYLYCTMFIAIPYFQLMDGALSFDLTYRCSWSHLGDSYFDKAVNILRFYEHIDFGEFIKNFASFISPLGFLPLVSVHFIAALPPMAILTLSNSPTMRRFGIYYSVTLLPFVFLAFIYSIKRIRAIDFITHKKLVSILSIILAINLFGGNLSRIISPARYSRIKYYKTITGILNSLPKETSLVTLSSILPHVSKRIDAGYYPRRSDADYILLNSKLNPWPTGKNGVELYLNELKSNSNYLLKFSKDNTYLFKKIKQEPGE